MMNGYMIYGIIIPVIIYAVAILNWKSEKERVMHPEPLYLHLIIATTASFVALFVFWGLPLGLMNSGYHENHIYKTVTTTNGIYSLEYNQNISGDFFLGSGSFSTSSDYVYFRAQDGGMIKDSIPCRTTIIYETDSTPRIEQDTFYHTAPKWRKTHCKSLNEWESTSKNIRLYVPTNTVIRSYSVQ